MRMERKEDYRLRRKYRVRKKIRGTGARPRMSVFVSNKQMYVQFIDDDTASTLASASTMGADLRSSTPKINVERAKKLGDIAAKAAIDKGIKVVVFDRAGFAFKGRVKAMADAAREAGLKF